jgi:hypothetical protein
MIDALHLFQIVKQKSDKRDAFFQIYVNLKREPTLSVFL